MDTSGQAFRVADLTPASAVGVQMPLPGAGPRLPDRRRREAALRGRGVAVAEPDRIWIEEPQAQDGDDATDMATGRRAVGAAAPEPGLDDVSHRHLPAGRTARHPDRRRCLRARRGQAALRRDRRLHPARGDALPGRRSPPARPAVPVCHEARLRRRPAAPGWRFTRQLRAQDPRGATARRISRGRRSTSWSASPPWCRARACT